MHFCVAFLPYDGQAMATVKPTWQNWIRPMRLISRPWQISLSSPAHTTAHSHPSMTTWPFTCPVGQQGWLYCFTLSKMDLPGQQISARREILALSEASLSATVLDYKRCIKMSPTYRNFLSFMLLPTIYFFTGLKLEPRSSIIFAAKPQKDQSPDLTIMHVYTRAWQLMPTRVRIRTLAERGKPCTSVYR